MPHQVKFLNDLTGQIFTLFILTVPDGRLDQSMYHVNFFSKISLDVILKKIYTNFHFKLYNFNGSAICAILKKK